MVYIPLIVIPDLFRNLNGCHSLLDRESKKVIVRACRELSKSDKYQIVFYLILPTIYYLLFACFRDTSRMLKVFAPHFCHLEEETQMSFLLSRSAEKRRRRELSRLITALRRKQDETRRLVLVPQIQNLEAKLGLDITPTEELLQAKAIVNPAPAGSWLGQLPPPPGSPAWNPRSYNLG